MCKKFLFFYKKIVVCVFKIIREYLILMIFDVHTHPYKLNYGKNIRTGLRNIIYTKGFKKKSTYVGIKRECVNLVTLILYNIKIKF